MLPGQHPLGVAVEDRGSPFVGLGNDGGRRRAADARQGAELGLGGREIAAVIDHDDVCRSMKVARPGVVAEAGPQVQHLVELGGCQGRHIGKPTDEAFEVGHHGGDLGLLQHDLGDPHAIGRPRSLPGQILAAVGVPPREQATGEVVH